MPFHLQLKTIFELYNNKIAEKPNREATSQSSKLHEVEFCKFKEESGWQNG